MAWGWPWGRPGGRPGGGLGGGPGRWPGGGLEHRPFQASGGRAGRVSGPGRGVGGRCMLTVSTCIPEGRPSVSAESLICAATGTSRVAAPGTRRGTPAEPTGSAELRRLCLGLLGKTQTSRTRGHDLPVAAPGGRVGAGAVRGGAEPESASVVPGGSLRRHPQGTSARPSALGQSVRPLRPRPRPQNGDAGGDRRGPRAWGAAECLCPDLPRGDGASPTVTTSAASRPARGPGGHGGTRRGRVAPGHVQASVRHVLHVGWGGARRWVSGRLGTRPRSRRGERPHASGQHLCPRSVVCPGARGALEAAPALRNVKRFHVLLYYYYYYY